MSEDPKEARAIVRRRRRWSSVWLVPAVAVILAGWLVWKHYSDQGPLATVRFETADGIAAGKTEVRCRSVRVGLVETVDLAPDLQSVIVGLRIDPDAAPLLREGSRLWVVRPRVSASELSGLGTLITGAYIELEPGDGPPGVLKFQGLEEPPVTSTNVPGLRLTLVADEAGSLAAGSPIYFRGFEVGRVERRRLDLDQRRILFEVFIKHEFAGLVREGTCFWNTSGVDVNAGADGFRIRTPSLQAMLTGGASFAVPEGGVAGGPAKNGDVYKLHANENAAKNSIFNPDRRCLLFFDQSVRGLKPGAPVEFRGLPLGRVVEISYRHSPSGDSRVPVEIEIHMDTLRQASDQNLGDQQLLATAVRDGLRAKLSTGSLLTGALFVEFDFVPDAPAAEIAYIDDLPVIPTQSSGLFQIEAKVNAILTKLEALPLDETLTKFGNAADEIASTAADARSALAEAEAALAGAKELLNQDKTKNLTAELDATLKQLRSSIDSLGPNGPVQGDLSRTLDELRSALRSFKALSDTIEDKPNSLIFGREGSGDPTPRAKR